MDRVALAEATSEELTEAVRQVHAIETSARAALLELVALCEERKVWAEDGSPSMESWLAGWLGTSWRTAAEVVRVARSLEDLPAVASVFASGALSWDKVRPLATVATPECDAAWAEAAPSMSVSALESAGRRHRERSEAEAAAAHHGRKLCFRDHRALPVTHITGWVPTAQAAVMRTAIEREADKVPPNPETGELDPYAARRVDGLYKICSQSLGADSDPDRATVVLHEQPDGSLALADGTGLADSAAERLRCDCREQHADGTLSKVISPALRRMLMRRDGGCTFPGCEQRHWLHAHHVIFRSKGGPTVAWNLRMTCGFHHHKIHEPGWRAEFDPAGTCVTSALTAPRSQPDPRRPSDPSCESASTVCCPSPTPTHPSRSGATAPRPARRRAPYLALRAPSVFAGFSRRCP